MRIRFSLFTLAIALTVFAIVVGVASNRARITKANQKTIDELRRFKIFAEFEDGTVQQDGRSNFWSSVKIKRIVQADNVTSDKAIEQIADLRDLRFVQLGEQVTDEGLVHLKNLHKLEELTIFSPLLTNDGLKKITHLNALKAVDLSFSSITNEGLEHLVHLPDLESLSIIDTKITDEGMKTVAKLPALRHLNIQNTEIGNSGLQTLAALKTLESVDITGSQATYGGLGNLLIDSLGRPFGDWFVTQIEILGHRRGGPKRGVDRTFVLLNGANYDDEAVPYLTNGLPGLTSLRLSSTSLSNKGVRELGEASQLESLAIDDMDHLDEIAGISSLEQLEIYSSSDRPLPRLVDLPNLKKLTCRVGEKQIATISQCPQLQELEAIDSDLVDTDLTDDCLKILSKMDSLETLRIGGDKVTDEGVAHLANLANLPKLQQLYIYCPNVTDASTETLRRMKSLRILRVVNKRMTKSAWQDVESSLPNCDSELRVW